MPLVAPSRQAVRGVCGDTDRIRFVGAFNRFPGQFGRPLMRSGLQSLRAARESKLRAAPIQATDEVQLEPDAIRDELQFALKAGQGLVGRHQRLPLSVPTEKNVLDVNLRTAFDAPPEEPLNVEAVGLNHAALGNALDTTAGPVGTLLESGPRNSHRVWIYADYNQDSRLHRNAAMRACMALPLQFRNPRRESGHGVVNAFTVTQQIYCGVSN